MLEEIIKERERKLQYLKERGINPYPAQTKRSTTIGDVIKNFGSLKRNKKNFDIVGRIRAFRDQGKIIFLELEDISGRIQIILNKENISEFSTFKKTLDIGDFIHAFGSAFLTKRGEKSVLAKKVTLLTKSLRSIPSDFYGLEDTEIRLRKRYLDTLLNKEARDIFMKKSLFWKSLRAFLDREGFIEVDTPVLEAIAGGAEAEPFVTHHNALDEDFYLRIALEISLKKMIVGGFEKIYEIGRVFRNEGIDAEHLQDYTQMEFYWAYANYRDLMKLLEKMYKFVIKETFGTLTLSWQGKKIHWGKKWAVVDYTKAFKEKNKFDPLKATKEELLKRATKLGIKPEKKAGRGRLIDIIYKKTVRPTLIEPTFLINTPTLVSPLAKRSPENPDVTERLQIVACGTELGNGFSELNDPLDQRARFEEQSALRKEGDKEAHMFDEEFLEALEYGMPPTAGFGLSERLFAILIDKPIREIIFSPPMKKK